MSAFAENAFTESANLVLRLTSQEAERLQHSHIGAEHLLLAFVESWVIRETRFSRLEPSTSPMLSTEIKRVVELAIDEAHQRGDRQISEHHLLLALMSHGEGTAGKVLKRMDIVSEQVYEHLRESAG